jgi:hypothetical protein
MRASLVSAALAVCWLLPEPAASQNLVPNGGFESFSPCPYFFDQLNFADHWFKASLGTPDFYNGCASSFVGVPSNQAGTQTPRSGNGYAGLIFWKSGATWYEYAESPLSAPLVAGRFYIVSFWVSRAEDASGWATDGLGAYLSQGPLLDSTSSPLDVVPQVLNAGGVITDTVSWVEIRGGYVAQGGEDHITIGNFEHPAATAVATLPSLPPVAYYYVDDVSVAPGCPDGATVIDFDGQGVSGPGTGFFNATPYVEDGFEVWNPYPVLVYGDAHPFYTGSPAVTSDDSHFFIQRESGGTFDVCSIDLAETDSAGPHFAILEGEPTNVSHAFGVNPPSPDPETVYPSGFQSLTRLHINDLPTTPRRVQFDNVCLCPTGSCTCADAPVLITTGVGRFCVAGSANGNPWRWQLDSEPNVLVPGLTAGAPASAIAAAFATSITDDGPPGASAVQDLGQLECFQVSYTSGFTLSVGIGTGPISCTVTGNPSGCSFNPTVTDASFLPPYPGSPYLYPPPIPALGPGSRALLVAVLALVGIALFRQRAWRA